MNSDKFITATKVVDQTGVLASCQSGSRTCTSSYNTYVYTYVLSAAADVSVWSFSVQIMRVQAGGKKKPPMGLTFLPCWSLMIRRLKVYMTM